MLRLFLLVACVCAALADHADVCSERTPDHDSSAVAADGNGGYFVFTEALDGYDAGREYRGEPSDGWTARSVFMKLALAHSQAFLHLYPLQKLTVLEVIPLCVYIYMFDYVAVSFRY